MPTRSSESVGPFQILSVLAVVLHEAAHVEQHVVVGVHGAEQIALAHAAARGSADIDFPLAAFDRDGAKILHVGFGTIAGAARRGELHLVWRLHALEPAFDLLGKCDGVSDAIAAEVGSDAALAGSKRLRVRVTARHAEFFPDVGEVVPS